MGLTNRVEWKHHSRTDADILSFSVYELVASASYIFEASDWK